MRLFGGGWREGGKTIPYYLVHETYCGILCGSERRVTRIYFVYVYIEDICVCCIVVLSLNISVLVESLKSYSNPPPHELLHANHRSTTGQLTHKQKDFFFLSQSCNQNPARQLIVT